eukprot:jgi/Astpho2/7584/fgenesh1_pg.00115_%23_25_t
MSQASWLPNAEDTSQSTAQLDKYGGRHRPAIKRGNSMEARLEWLQEGLVKQQSDMESALHRDDSNARWELDQQERRRQARMKSQGLAFGSRASDSPYSQTMRSPGGSRTSRDSGASRRADTRESRTTRGTRETSETPDTRNTSLAGQLTPIRTKADQQYPLRGELHVEGQRPGSAPVRKKPSIVVPKSGKGSGRGMFSPKTPMRAAMPPLWRQNISKAKRKFRNAMRAVSIFKTAVHSTPDRIERLDSFGLLLHMVLGPDLERFGETQTKLQNMVERAQRLLASTAVVAGDESATAGLAKDSKKGLPDPNSVNTPTSAMASRVPPGLPDSSAAFADGAVGAASSSEHAEAIESVRANANRAVIGAEAEERLKAQQMLRMLANRSNSRWVEKVEWEAPFTFDTPRFLKLLGGEQFEHYKRQVLELLLLGQVAVQLIAGEDTVVMPDESRRPIWGVDTWGLVRAACPNRLPGNDRIEGLSLGTRQLLALRVAIEELAGAEALAKLVLIIHTSDEQEAALLQELKLNKLHGFQRENVMIVPQQRRAGYCYRTEGHSFVRQIDSEEHLCGSGYAMMQLAWHREAFTLGANLTTREFLPGSVLAALESRGVQWLCSGRSSDLGRCSVEGAFELDCLAHTMRLAEERGCNCSFEVKLVDGLPAARQQNSLVLSQKGDVRGRKTEKDTAKFGMDLKHCDLQAQKLPSLGLQPRVWCFLGQPHEHIESHKLAGHLSELTRGMKGQLLVNTDRYCFHLETLAKLLRKGHTLSGPSGKPAISRVVLQVHGHQHILLLEERSGVSGAARQSFRPDVDLHQHHAFVSFHMADLTTMPEVYAAPLVSKVPLQTLRTHKQFEDIVPHLVKQDRSPTFRAAVARMKASSGAGSSPSQTGPTANKGLCIVVFVADNEASNHAASLARSLVHPARDSVHIATSIAADSGFADAQRLLTRHTEQFELSTRMKTDVLVRGTQALVDCLLEHASGLQADLIVMGSHQISKPDSALIGSVALSLLKKCERPMVIARPSSFVPKGDSGVRAMLVVEHTARPLLNWMVSRLVDTVRGDKLFLARANAKDSAAQDTMTTRQLLDQFAEVAGAKRVATVKRALVGSNVTEAYVSAAEMDRVHLLAVQAPLDKAVPPHVIDLLRASRAPVLLMRTNQQW